jgi:hypothetical protein
VRGNLQPPSQIPSPPGRGESEEFRSGVPLESHFAILFASAIAADQPFDTRTALIFTRSRALRRRTAARYFPCRTIAAFRTAETRFRAGLAGPRVGRAALRAARIFRLAPFARRVVSCKPSTPSCASLSRISWIRRSRRLSAFWTSRAANLPSWMRNERACRACSAVTARDDLRRLANVPPSFGWIVSREAARGFIG